MFSGQLLVFQHHTNLFKEYGLNEKVLNRNQTKNDDEKTFALKFNEYVFKITELIEKFQLNVAIAKIYEITSI